MLTKRPSALRKAPTRPEVELPAAADWAYVALADRYQRRLARALERTWADMAEALDEKVIAEFLRQTGSAGAAWSAGGVELVDKHLAGKHDQASHGKKGSVKTSLSPEQAAGAPYSLAEHEAKFDPTNEHEVGYSAMTRAKADIIRGHTVAKAKMQNEVSDTTRPTTLTREAVESVTAADVEVMVMEDLRQRALSGPIQVQVPASVLTDLVHGDGRLRNQHETGTSSGWNDPGLRGDHEGAMFGAPETPRGQVEAPGHHPIYGTAGPPIGMMQYGEVALIMSPDVRARTTVTFGDSLDTGRPPRPIRLDEVESASIDRLEAATTTQSIASLAEAYTYQAAGDPRPYRTLDEAHGDLGYIEAQIHGRVSLDDVVGHEWVADPTFTSPTPAVRELEAMGKAIYELPPEGPFARRGDLLAVRNGDKVDLVRAGELVEADCNWQSVLAMGYWEDFATSLSKHLQGHHDQKSHGRGGKTAESAPRKPSMAQATAGMNIGEKVAWFDGQSRAERDRLSDATRSIDKHITATLHPRREADFDGMDAADAVRKRIADHADMVEPEARAMIEDMVANQLAGAFTEMGVDGKLSREFCLDTVDTVMAQEIEAMGRTLGDHGIHHLSQDARLSTEAIRTMQGGTVTARQRAMMITAAAYHDTGYLTPPSRSFMDSEHPRSSMQHWKANVETQAAAIFGVSTAREIRGIIASHDQNRLDWKADVEGSAFRLADNLGLFHQDKLPGVVRVPGNTQVLVGLGRRIQRIKDSNLPDDVKRARTDAAVETARIQMRRNVHANKGQYTPTTIANFDKAIDEVSPVLPKFTVGMLGGEVGKMERTPSGHLAVDLHRNAANQALSSVMDGGQRQFIKFAESFDVDPHAFRSNNWFSFAYKGNVALEVTVLGPSLMKCLLAKAQPVTMSPLSPIYAEILRGSASATDDEVGGAIAGVAFGFDFPDELGAAWAETRSAQMVTEVNDTTRQMISELVASGQMGDLTPNEIARSVRQFVGLRSDQVRAVQNYQSELARLMGLQMARPPGSLAHQRPGAGAARSLARRFALSPWRGGTLTPEKVQALSDQYAARQRRDRAEMIARTETMTAANAGRRMAMQQLVNQGYLSGSVMVEKWKVTHDDRLCSTCAPMDGRTLTYEAVNETTRLNQPWESYERNATLNVKGQRIPWREQVPPTAVPHPPQHPRCRCVTVWEITHDGRAPELVGTGQHEAEQRIAGLSKAERLTNEELESTWDRYGLTDDDVLMVRDMRIGSGQPVSTDALVGFRRVDGQRVAYVVGTGELAQGGRRYSPATRRDHQADVAAWTKAVDGVHANIVQALKPIPLDARPDILRRVNLIPGRNPGDVQASLIYGTPFRTGATAYSATRTITAWGEDPPNAYTIAHEIGHLVDTKFSQASPTGTTSGTTGWRRAAESDQAAWINGESPFFDRFGPAPRPWNNYNSVDPQVEADTMRDLWSYESGFVGKQQLPWRQAGTSTYAHASATIANKGYSEDFAEAYAMYARGPAIGSARKPDGFYDEVWFGEMFPNRKTFFDHLLHHAAHGVLEHLEGLSLDSDLDELRHNVLSDLMEPG